MSAAWAVRARSVEPVPVPVAGERAVGSPDRVDPGPGWHIERDRPWPAALVRITTDRCADQIQGTGVIVDGRIWTNRHVVADGRRVRVTFSDGRVETVTGVSVATDLDLAVLDLDAVPSSSAHLTWLHAPMSAADVGTIAGFPGGGRLRLDAVTVVGSRAGWGDRDPTRPLVLDAEVRPGQSGSPLVTDTGQVAGLVYARSEPDGNALVIAADEIMAAAPSMTATATVC